MRASVAVTVLASSLAVLSCGRSGVPDRTTPVASAKPISTSSATATVMSPPPPPGPARCSDLPTTETKGDKNRRPRSLTEVEVGAMPSAMVTFIGDGTVERFERSWTAEAKLQNTWLAVIETERFPREGREPVVRSELEAIAGGPLKIDREGFSRGERFDATWPRGKVRFKGSIEYMGVMPFLTLSCGDDEPPAPRDVRSLQAAGYLPRWLLSVLPEALHGKGLTEARRNATMLVSERREKVTITFAEPDALLPPALLKALTALGMKETGRGELHQLDGRTGGVRWSASLTKAGKPPYALAIERVEP